MRIAIYSPTFYPVIDGTSIQSKRQVDLLSKDYDVRGISFLVDREIKECKMLEEVEDGIIRIKPTYSDSPKKRFPSLKGENIVFDKSLNKTIDMPLLTSFILLFSFKNNRLEIKDIEGNLLELIFNK